MKIWIKINQFLGQCKKLTDFIQISLFNGSMKNCISNGIYMKDYTAKRNIKVFMVTKGWGFCLILRQLPSFPRNQHGQKDLQYNLHKDSLFQLQLDLQRELHHNKTTRFWSVPQLFDIPVKGVFLFINT